MGALLTHAWDENKVLVHVDSVAKGKDCGCRCPICEYPLSARQGQIRASHFAHLNNHDCKGSDETILHQMAKEVLLEEGQLMLPPSSGDFPSGLVKLFDIKSEIWDEKYRIRPDVEGITENGQRVLIEFYVSHEVKEKKRRIIIDNDLKCIEIDLNYQNLDKDEIRVFLTKSSAYRKWIIQKETNRKEKGGVPSSSNPNPVYRHVGEVLRNTFVERTLYLHPYKQYIGNYTMFDADVLYDLKGLGYDIYKVHYKYRKFNSDLLLSKTNAEGKKSFISINVRGRRRSEGFRYPNGWMIIDIILKRGSTVDNFKDHWAKGIIIQTPVTDVFYKDFDEWRSKERPVPTSFEKSDHSLSPKIKTASL